MTFFTVAEASVVSCDSPRGRYIPQPAPTWRASCQHTPELHHLGPRSSAVLVVNVDGVTLQNGSLPFHGCHLPGSHTGSHSSHWTGFPSGFFSTGTARYVQLHRPASPHPFTPPPFPPHSQTSDSRLSYSTNVSHITSDLPHHRSLLC